MDLSLSDAETGFRLEVQAFLEAEQAPALTEKVRSGAVPSKDERISWYRRLHARGWMAPNWPVAYGGAGWSPMMRLIFEEESSAYGAPLVIAQGVQMLGPILIAYATDEQKARYLPRILTTEDWWCQGYSEPDAGSDLASLQTRATREDETYVVSGQKIWITQADIADMMFALVRTSSPERRHDGITFILIDMRSPGITVRSIETLNHEREIAEVFFDAVRVPVANRIGEEGAGWSIAMSLLEHERSAVGNVARAREQLAVLRRRPLTLRLAERASRLEVRALAMRYMQLRTVAAANSGASPGRESSLLKVAGTELMQEISALAFEAAGVDAWARDAREPATYFDQRKLSIFSGSNEIQRNIVAKHVLGL